jgi:hypothetical protein
MAMTVIEVCVLVDSDGNCAVGLGSDEVHEAYANAVGELSAVDGHRMLYLTLNVPLPECVALEGTVPEDGSNATMTVK